VAFVTLTVLLRERSAQASSFIALIRFGALRFGAVLYGEEITARALAARSRPRARVAA
jgi:hypothetical protein